jgi:putative FmdB family regulatory protein
MPSYEYACPDCGGFAATRPLAEYDMPAACPGCGQQAPRALTVPQLAATDSPRRVSEAVIERSANAPRSSGAHGSACGCCRPRGLGTTASRPWMIGH